MIEEDKKIFALDKLLKEIGIFENNISKIKYDNGDDNGKPYYKACTSTGTALYLTVELYEKLGNEE